MTDFQNFMSANTAQAMDIYSGATFTIGALVGIRCDISESTLDLEVMPGGVKNGNVKSILVMKSAIPTGYQFRIGAKPNFDGEVLEIYSAVFDEISWTLTAGTPDQR
jgi:hypothetical protein